MDRRVLWAIGEMDRRLAAAEWAALALEVNLSPSRFAHLFRQETGYSPSRYLHTLRMERARLLLLRTFLSVKEVMAQVGITDASHFSRDFSKYHGASPSVVRRADLFPQSAFMSAHLDFVERARGVLDGTGTSANE